MTEQKPDSNLYSFSSNDIDDDDITNDMPEDTDNIDSQDDDDTTNELDSTLLDRIEDLGMDINDFIGMANERVVNILDGFEKNLGEETVVSPPKVIADIDFSGDVDSEIVEAFASLSNEVKIMGADLKTFREKTENQGDSALQSRVDTYIAGEEKRHGDGATKLFKSAAKRQEIAGAINILKKGYEGAGQRVPNELKLFRKAVYSTLGDDYAKMRGEKLTADVKDRQSGFTKRPDTRLGEPKDVVSKAIANLTANMDKTDYFNDGEVGEEF